MHEVYWLLSEYLIARNVDSQYIWWYGRKLPFLKFKNENFDGMWLLNAILNIYKYIWWI